jgi:hypothetical protein
MRQLSVDYLEKRMSRDPEATLGEKIKEGATNAGEKIKDGAKAVGGAISSGFNYTKNLITGNNKDKKDDPEPEPKRVEKPAEKPAEKKDTSGGGIFGWGAKKEEPKPAPKNEGLSTSDALAVGKFAYENKEKIPVKQVIAVAKENPELTKAALDAGKDAAGDKKKRRNVTSLFG